MYSARLFYIILLISGFSYLTISPIAAQTTCPNPYPLRSFFISPIGNDANSGISQSTPIKTFSKAWQLLCPGDTLHLMDGTYTPGSTGMIQPPGVLNGVPNPDINAQDYQTYPLDHPERTRYYIHIKAVNDGQAILDAQNSTVPVSLGHQLNGWWGNDHFFIEGLIAMNSSGSVYLITSSNVIIRRCSGYNANTHGNNHVFTVYSGGDAITPANILLEDNIAAGSGRKMFLAYVTYHNVVFRRNFAAWQSWLGDQWCGSPWPQTNGIEIYPERGGDQPNIANNTFMENNISFGMIANAGISFSPNTGARYGNHILGNIAIGNGLRWNNNLKIFENKRFDGGPLYDLTGNNCTVNETSKPSSCASSTCQLKEDDNRLGLSIGPFESPFFHNNEIRNNISVNNGGLGLFAGPWAAGSTNNVLDSNTFINNSLGEPPPLYAANSLATYDVMGFQLAQFSSLSNLKIGKVWNGTNPAPGTGARLDSRYQYGQLTTQPLWPWPMEERIRSEFANPDLFQSDGIPGRVWINFSVTQAVCQTYLLSHGAVSSCPTVTQPTPSPPTTSPTSMPFGDLDNDSDTDWFDLSILISNFHQLFAPGNFNLTGLVDLFDLSSSRYIPES